jgi:CSLREA domain-containing protein
MRRETIIKLLCLSIFLFAMVIAVRAAPRTVDTTADNGNLTACTSAPNDCSLRGAVLSAATNDTINFDTTLFSTPQTINLNTWISLTTNKTLQIVGPGANLLTITGTGNTIGFFYLFNGNTTIQNITFANIIGNSIFGVSVVENAIGKIENCVFHDISTTGVGVLSGAVIGNEGNLTINNSEFYNNTVAINTDAVTAISGVTVRNSGRLGIGIGNNTTITNSIIKDNVGNGVNGLFVNGSNCTFVVSNSLFTGNINTTGSLAGAAIALSHGNLFINNSTFTGNSSFAGSALAVQAFGGATFTINNSTVTGNNSSSGGAVYNLTNEVSTIRNSIIAGNTGNARPDLAGNITTTSNNLLGIVNNNYTGFIDGNGNPINNNLVGTQANPLNARLASLANNGGPTQTFALLSNSPAVNAGNNCVLTANGCGDNNAALTNDQRGTGFPRQIDSNIDIGAFESNFVSVTNDANSGAGSLRNAIANSPVGATIIFSPSFFSQPRTITLTSGQILINKNLTINGTGANMLTIDGNLSSRIFNIAGGATVSVNRVKLTRGDAVTSPGGCVSNNGTFNLSDSEILNCKGSSGGAIFNDFNATLSVSSSTLAVNQAIGGEGGAVSNCGLFFINNSTVSGNSAVSSKGGGIYNVAPSNVGVYLNNVTITKNVANYGGGVFNEFAPSSFVSARNSIFEENIINTRGPDFDGAVCSGGGNLFSDANWAGIACNTTGNILNVSARLAPLGDYGGTTRTHALLPNSPALNAGTDCVLTANGCGDNNPALTLDQRGSQRKIGASVDIGAFERNITFDQNTLPNGRQTVAYNQQLSVTRATSLAEDLLMNEKFDSNILLAPFTFSVVTVSGQQLPPGLVLSSSGLLSGVATQAGTFTFTVKAADTDSIAGVHQYTVTILANSAPTISGATISRRACLPVSNSTIATVDDFENGASAVTVTVTSANPSNGVTVSNIVNTNGTITANVVANCSANGNVTFTLAASDGNLTTNAALIVNVTSNAAPTISGATISRNASQPISNSTIATVDDFETGASGVTVTVTSANPSNGVTVSNIVNTNGTITANVVANCSATTATFTLTASDGNLTTSGTLTVIVTPNAAPSLQYPASQFYYGNTLNVSPTLATDESTTSFGIQNVSPALTNAPTINSSNGTVSFSSGNQVGSYIITVRATDICGSTTDASLPLEVTRTRIVTKTGDLWDGVCDADCSLRDAVESAGSGDVVAFSSLFDTPQTISLSFSRPFVISTPLTINGPGANLLTVNGDNRDHVFFINPTDNVTIRGMKITGGSGFQGGSGIISLAQDVTLENLVITGNQTISDSPGGGIAVSSGLRMNIYNSVISNNSAVYGGGIYVQNGATVKIYNSTISGNTATSPATFGGGGAINAFDATVYLSNSTLSENSAPNNYGGGIRTVQSGQLFINNSTISNNRAIAGGGIYHGFAQQIYYNVRNTIIAGNSANSDPDVNGNFGFLDSVFSNNLIGNSGSATGFNGTNNQIGTSSSPINAKLAPLGDYGGTMPTHALLSDSPAINAGSDCVLTENGCGDNNPLLALDQRGSQRKIGSSVDIGAFEKNVSLDPATLPTGVRNVFYSQQLSATRATSLAENSLTAKEVGWFNSRAVASFTFSVISISGQQLPPGLSLSSSGVLSGTPTEIGTFTFTVKAADADSAAGVHQYSLTIDALNIPPTIAGATLTRQAGSPISNSTIATVNDVENGANGVSVTVSSANPSNGVTVSNIVNTNGTVTADVIADCSATNTTFILTASAGDRTANAALTVNVSANTAPTLVYTSPQSVLVGNSVGIVPTTRSDNGTISYSIFSVTPGLTNPLTVDSNGIVSIASAEPVGSYVIVVRATDNCGLTIDASFTLDVTQPPALTVTKIEDTQDFSCDDDCSLREALLFANPGDHIQFSPLFDTPQTIAIDSELVINKSVTIDGKGANLLTIDAQNLLDVRVFNVQATPVNINNLTVTHGNLVDSSSFDGGAGILVQFGGTLDLVKVVVANNSSVNTGGGVSVRNGTLNIINSRITNNRITGNTIGGAGIVVNDSNFYMTGSTVSGNIAPNLITSNTIGGGLAILNNNGSARIENSTVSGNLANSGGGIANVSGNLFMSNVTVSGNSSVNSGAGIRVHSNYSVTLRNCTIASNSGGSGGGIYIFPNGTVNLANTIVADNSGFNADIYGLGSNTFVNAAGTNIVETGIGGGSMVGGSGTILQVDPKLAPLGNYGGATQTRAIGANSPAINAGSNTEALDTNAAVLTFDQRGNGAPRIVGTTVDLGAFESNIIFDQSTLPNGSTSAFYSQTLTATRQTGFAEFAAPDNLAPFTFSIINGALPPGLSLAPNGTLSGTPTQPGTFTFTVKAVDGADTLAGVKQFVIQVFAPTAANASVSGRILTTSGGLGNARVILTDLRGNSRTVSTGTFGYYRFDNVAVGETYIVSVVSKRFTFASQVISVMDNITELNFTANE